MLLLYLCSTATLIGRCQFSIRKGGSVEVALAATALGEYRMLAAGLSATMMTPQQLHDSCSSDMCECVVQDFAQCEMPHSAGAGALSADKCALCGCTDGQTCVEGRLLCLGVVYLLQASIF